MGHIGNQFSTQRICLFSIFHLNLNTINQPFKSNCQTVDFITALPKGYDTPLSERGQNLSQGQRQLLAFARVLAADPEILVLDEATASIDTETELLIQDALRKLTEGRTSILIAHRLQTIQEANRVLVLQDGKVEELGTHEELLAAGGLYHTLHSLQFQAEPEA